MAGGGNAIRGSRVGAGPMGEAERGEAAPRQAVTYFCSHGHRSVVTFAVEAAVPDSWDCPRCGLPASLDSENPPPAPKIEPYKTHLAYVKERRSDAEADNILDEALSSSAPAASPATSSSELSRVAESALLLTSNRPSRRYCVAVTPTRGRSQIDAGTPKLAGALCTGYERALGVVADAEDVVLRRRRPTTTLVLSTVLAPPTGRARAARAPSATLLRRTRRRSRCSGFARSRMAMRTPSTQHLELRDRSRQSAVEPPQPQD